MTTIRTRAALLLAALSAVLLMATPAGAADPDDATAPPVAEVPTTIPAGLADSMRLPNAGWGSYIQMTGLTSLVTVVCDPSAGVDRAAIRSTANSAGVATFPTVTDGGIVIEFAVYKGDQLLARSGCLTGGTPLPSWGYPDAYTPTAEELQPGGELAILPGEGVPAVAPAPNTSAPSSPPSGPAATTGPRIGSVPALMYDQATPSSAIVDYGVSPGTSVTILSTEVINAGGSAAGFETYMVQVRVGARVGWIRTNDMTDLPTGLVPTAAPATSVSTPAVANSSAGTYTPPTLEQEPSGWWTWAVIAGAVFVLVNLLRIRADLRGDSVAGTKRETAAALGMIPCALVAAATVAGHGLVASVVTVVLAAVVGQVWIMRRAANRGVALGLLGSLRALDNNWRASVLGAGVGAVAGFFLFHHGLVAALAVGALVWSVVAGMKATADIRRAVLSRQQLYGALRTILGISQSEVELVAMTIIADRITVETPPATALRLAEIPERVAQVLGDWTVTSADARQIVLVPLAYEPAEQERRAHVAESGGLIVGTTKHAPEASTSGATPSLVITMEDLEAGR